MLKRISVLFLIITLLLSAFTVPCVFSAGEIDKWDGTTAATAFAGGNGTEDDPYLISNCAQLILLRNIVNEIDAKYDELYKDTYGERSEGAVVSGDIKTHMRLPGKYFKLTADLDMDGKNIGKGIGNSTGIKETYTFAGNFDGNGHIIKNYYTYYAWDLRAMGLFGITENAVIANLGMENAKINVSNKSNTFGYAVLVGKAYGTLKLDDCYVKNSVAEVTYNLGDDTDMGIGILTGSIGAVKKDTVTHKINNCYSVNNEIRYSGETVPHQFKRASVFGKTEPHGINVNNCYTGKLKFVNVTSSECSDRTNNMFTPSVSGNKNYSSTGKNCFAEGEPSIGDTDYLKQGETFTAVTSEELKALPSELNTKGAYDTKYAEFFNDGYPILLWESEKYAPTAVWYETAKGIIDNFDFSMISGEDASAVTENLNLFTEMYGLTCLWQSSRNSSISPDGTVKRDFVDRKAVLTLSVQLPNGNLYPKTKKISVTVLSENSDPASLTMKFDKWNGGTAKSFDGGDGTAENPYQIATGSQLALLRDIVNAKSDAYDAGYKAIYGERTGGQNHTFAGQYFVLTADIDLANNNFGDPIGKCIDSANTFYFDGNFDGDGHVIKNFTLTSGVRNSGLFGYINNSEIKNVGLENVNIVLNEATAAGSYGMLASMAAGGNVISGCFVKNGAISVTNKMSGTVTMRLGAICASIGISGTTKETDKTTVVENCYAVNSSFDYTAGNSVVFDCASIIGYVGNHRAVVKNCYAANAVFGDDMIFPTITKKLGMMFRPNLGASTSTVENCFVLTDEENEGAYSFAMGTVQKVSAETLSGLPGGLNSDDAFTQEYSKEANGGFPMLVWEKYAYELIEHMIYNQFDFSKISSEPADAVCGNLNFVTDLGFGVSGRWTSDNTLVIENNGTVHRRSFEQKANVTMEIIFRGDTVFPKKISYDVTVSRLEGYSDEEILKEYLDVIMTDSYFTDQPVSEITENLKNVFPSDGPDGVGMLWEISDEMHIAPDGTVTRPSWNENDASVNIKLKAVKGEATAEKVFTFTVLKHIDPETAIGNALDSVTYDVLTAEKPSAITKNINLPIEFDDYVSASWSSSREDVISNEGKVNRQMKNTDVTLTVTFTHSLSGEKKSKSFSFTVLISADGKVMADYEAIAFKDMNQIVSGFDLPLAGSVYQSTISWTSSNIDVMSVKQYNGTAQTCVKRPSFEEGDQPVTLTAKIENDGQNKSFAFDFTVLKQPSDTEAVQYAYNLITYETVSAEPANEIRNTLSLVKEFETGVLCDWTVSDEKTVSRDGKIFPSLNEDKAVTLTVNIHKGTASQTKSFDFVIKGLSERELLEKACEYLTFDTLTDESINGVCNDFVLPNEGDFGTVISWKSGSADLLELADDGGKLTARVKRPSFAENGKMVSLSAIVSLGGETAAKEFFLTIKAQPTFTNVFSLDFENGELGNVPADSSSGTWAKTNDAVSAVIAGDPDGGNNKVMAVSNSTASTAGYRYTNGFNDKATVNGIVYAEMRLFVPSDTQSARICLFNFSEMMLADVTFQQNGQVVVTVFDQGYREIFLKSKENVFPLDKWNDVLMVCNTETGKMDLFLNGECISNYGDLTVNGDVYFDSGIPFKSAPMMNSAHFPLRKVRIDAKMGTVYADDICFKQLSSRYSESLYKAMETVDMKFRSENNIEVLNKDLKIPDPPAGYILKTYSSNNSVLTDNGRICEVIDSDGYAEFTIELEYLAEKVRKTYPVRVTETVYTDEERAVKDMNEVYSDITSRYDFSNIRDDISFASFGKYGSEITLVSDNIGAVSNNGRITRKSADQKATLKLTARRNDAVVEKNFAVVVKAKETTKNVSDGKGGSSSAASIAFGKNAAQNISIRPDGPVSLNDVDASHWAYDAITALAEKGIVSGGTDGNFEPDSCIKREEFLKMLLLAFNIEIGDYKNDFNDVDKTAWYRLYVSSARYNKIILGDEDGSFGAGRDITRQDMAVMVCRLKKLSAGRRTGSVFDDDAQIADYAKDAVYSMRAKGFLTGKGENRFAPQDSTTRAEAAMLLYRISNSK